MTDLSILKLLTPPTCCCDLLLSFLQLIFSLFDFQTKLLFMGKPLSRDAWPWLNISSILSISPQEFVMVFTPLVLLKKQIDSLLPFIGAKN